MLALAGFFRKKLPVEQLQNFRCRETGAGSGGLESSNFRQRADVRFCDFAPKSSLTASHKLSPFSAREQWVSSFKF